MMLLGIKYLRRQFLMRWGIRTSSTFGMSMLSYHRSHSLMKWLIAHFSVLFLARVVRFHISWDILASSNFLYLSMIVVVSRVTRTFSLFLPFHGAHGKVECDAIPFWTMRRKNCWLIKVNLRYIKMCTKVGSISFALSMLPGDSWNWNFQTNIAVFSYKLSRLSSIMFTTHKPSFRKFCWYHNFVSEF